MKKKILIVLAVLMSVISLFFFAKRSSILAPGIYSPITTADISLMVYKSYDYTQAIYSTCVAGINLTVEKVNSNGKATPVWRKNIDAKTLSEYPSIDDAIKQNVVVPTVSKKSEYLILTYNVIYNTNGHKLEIPKTILLDKKSVNAIAISI